MSDTHTQKPLSILHTENSTGWGGQEIRILTEARGMLDRGHQVMLLTPANAEILPAAKKLSIPTTAIDIERKRILPLLRLRSWLADHGAAYDVINAHSSTDSWLSAVACASLKNMPPMIRTRHVSTPINNHRSTQWLYTKATSHIVTAGEALRQQLHRDNGYALSNMTSVRTGIDLQRYRPMCPADNKTILRMRLGLSDVPALGVLATLRDWKGHRDLLDAMVLLRERHPPLRHWRLVIIGDGPERERLAARIAELHLQPVVRMVGNQENVPEWLSALDLLTLPSYGAEGVPQGIMQGMACGLAVVSTTVGAINEAVQEGVTGYMVEPRDPAVLADALAKLMNDDVLRAQMGAASHAYAQAHFGIDVMLDKMETIFRAATLSQRAKQDAGKHP